MVPDNLFQNNDKLKIYELHYVTHKTRKELTKFEMFFSTIVLADQNNILKVLSTAKNMKTGSVRLS